jgi:putative transcription factor
LPELYCEVCGKPIVGKGHRILMDGAEMLVCDECFLKLTKSGRAVPVTSRPREVRPRPKKTANEVALEVVDNYPELIRAARESKGWTQAALAQKLKISEAMVKKIEGGKYKPTVDLAKKMEAILNIKLLQPVESEEEEEEPPEDYLTFGDVAVVRRDKNS